MKLFYGSYLGVLTIVMVLCFACKPVLNKYRWPAGYDFNEPEKFNMPGSLLEISGIAFLDDNSKVVYAVQDEEGKLFKLNWGDRDQSNVKFGSSGDYEDLAILNGTVFIVKSSGTIIAFPLPDANQKQTKKVKEWNKVLPKGEYESLYADQKNQTLYTICKDCKIDKKSRDATGYVLNYQAQEEALTIAGDFKIQREQIEALGHPIKSGLKTSALAKNPRTGEWYILSSVHKLLVVARPDWTVKAVYQLSSSRFLQPEGITFDKDYNLYISNEGDELSSGNILKFTYKPPKQLP